MELKAKASRPPTVCSGIAREVNEDHNGEEMCRRELDATCRNHVLLSRHLMLDASHSRTTHEAGQEELRPPEPLPNRQSLRTPLGDNFLNKGRLPAESDSLKVPRFLLCPSNGARGHCIGQGDRVDQLCDQKGEEIGDVSRGKRRSG